MPNMQSTVQLQKGTLKPGASRSISRFCRRPARLAHDCPSRHDRLESVKHAPFTCRKRTDREAICCYSCVNELRTIREIVTRVRSISLPLDLEIVIVDDFSTDGTRSILEELGRLSGVRIVLHKHNRGKGAALRTGFHEATGDVILIQDADWKTTPPSIQNCFNQYSMEKQMSCTARASWEVTAIGSFPSGTRLEIVCSRFLSNMFTDLNLSDMETCYKAFRREVLQSVDPRKKVRIRTGSHRLARRAPLPDLRGGHSVRRTNVRRRKKIGWRDGLRAIWCIVKFRPSRLRTSRSNR